MLNRIVRFSLRFRGVVIALACVVVGYGLYVAAHAKLDVLPNFVPPQVVVQTEAPGLSPEQVEVLVTRPVENTINGLGNMASLRSESIPGLSVITAVFKEGTDIFVARQMSEVDLGTVGRQPADDPRTVESHEGILNTNCSLYDLSVVDLRLGCPIRPDTS